jgi:hypothetical protein
MSVGDIFSNVGVPNISNVLAPILPSNARVYNFTIHNSGPLDAWILIYEGSDVIMSYFIPVGSTHCVNLDHLGGRQFRGCMHCQVSDTPGVMTGTPSSLMQLSVDYLISSINVPSGLR